MDFRRPVNWSVSLLARMRYESAMSEKRGEWIWKLLRLKKRKEIDRLEAELVRRPGTRRGFAGDPNQEPHMRLKYSGKPR